MVVATLFTFGFHSHSWIAKFPAYYICVYTDSLALDLVQCTGFGRINCILFLETDSIECCVGKR